MLRERDADEVTVTAVRDTVEAQTVEYEMLEDQIGYLAVSEFDSVTYGQYEEALEALSDQGMEGPGSRSPEQSGRKPEYGLRYAGTCAAGRNHRVYGG